MKRTQGWKRTGILPLPSSSSSRVYGTRIFFRGLTTDRRSFLHLCSHLKFLLSVCGGKVGPCDWNRYWPWLLQSWHWVAACCQRRLRLTKSVPAPSSPLQGLNFLQNGGLCMCVCKCWSHAAALSWCPSQAPLILLSPFPSFRQCTSQLENEKTQLRMNVHKTYLSNCVRAKAPSASKVEEPNPVLIWVKIRSIFFE